MAANLLLEAEAAEQELEHDNEKYVQQLVKRQKTATTNEEEEQEEEEDEKNKVGVLSLAFAITF